MPYSIPAFTCSCKPHGPETALVSVSGELDLATSPRLLAALQEARHGSELIILDLRSLSFMDCSGLHAILDAKAATDADGRHLLVVRGPPHVHKLFELSGVSQSLEIVELIQAQSVTDALPYLASMGTNEIIHAEREVGSQSVPINT